MLSLTLSIQLQNLILTNESLLFFIVIAITSFFILWTIVSIPVWILAKILRAKQAKFARAMLVTAAGPIAYGIVFLFLQDYYHQYYLLEIITILYLQQII
jgi:hypothetical protein